MQLLYKIDLLRREKEVCIQGVEEVNEVNHYSVWIKEKSIVKKVMGTIEFPFVKGMKIYMNGFQTWTYSPEYDANDIMWDFKGMPKAMVEKFSLNRYGDYHIVEYPKKKGLFHGFNYCYFREGEKYHLFASLNESNGYTIFRYDANTGVLSVEKDIAGLEVDESLDCFDLYYSCGSEEEVFDGWFKALGIKPRTSEQLKGYSSWYNRYQDINEKSIITDLEGCSYVLDKGDLFQIDDGWERAVGDWIEDDTKFPHGLKDAADKIHQMGYKAGLWLAPFVAQANSQIVKDHPEWFLKKNGQFWSNGSNWGGFYSLDIDNEEVVEHIRETFKRVFEWGFDLVKLDFLYGAAPFGTKQESRGAKMARAMKLIREVCGDHLVLGCGVPVMSAFGLVDYCRVSCDVSLDWDDKPYMRMAHRERVSTKQAIETTIFRRQLNGRAYLSDPDVFFLRDDNLKLTEKQKDTLATVCALFGGIYLNSDNMGQYDEAKKERYKALCQLKEATDIKVTADKKITVSYHLDDKEFELVV